MLWGNKFLAPEEYLEMEGPGSGIIVVLAFDSSIPFYSLVVPIELERSRLEFYHRWEK